MFYVATHRGFLFERDGRYYTTIDIRYAMPFKTFEEADAAGKDAVHVMFKHLRGVEHYAILVPAICGNTMTEERK